jgi:hypothetical protein
MSTEKGEMIMNINSKHDITMKNASESVKLQQSLNSSRAQSNPTDETEAGSAGQETQRASAAGPMSDTLDLSINPEIELNAMEGAGKIDSLDMAEEVSESVRQSILDNPEEAMGAQANSLPPGSIELIQ